MAEKIQAIRGMNDILPTQTAHWRYLESFFAEMMQRYGYHEIRMPLMESTALFKRSIGEVTDIVEKEMYTFSDLNGDSLTLRPEGTAGCIRACLEHGLLYNQQQKLWYSGPMFRHEKPQKGRYRQFHQFGVEVLGIAGTAIELELIALCKRLWQELGIAEHVHLQINSLGDLDERLQYRALLIHYLQEHYTALDEDSQRRLHRNPLRILDSKNPQVQLILADAPRLADVFGDASKNHFANLCRGLEKMDISYTINPNLVRGLDYYGQTVFEWVTDKLGSQATVCAGGRYDALTEQLGGTAVPAVGFALGIERLLLLIETIGCNRPTSKAPLFFFITAHEESLAQALLLAEDLRSADARYQVITNTAGGGFKSQFKKADKSGADYALIIGENEYQEQMISIKNLRNSEEQITIPQTQLRQYINDHLQ